MPQLRFRNRAALSGREVGHLVKQCPPDELIRRRAIYKALSDMGDVIYAIACDDGTIKIGFTGSLRERRRNHGVGFDQIIAVTPGTYEQEQELHQRFREHRARGWEYYHPHPDVVAFVNEIRVRAGVPPIPLRPA